MESLNAQFKGRIDDIHDELVEIYEVRPFYEKFGFNLYPLWEDVNDTCRKLVVAGNLTNYYRGEKPVYDAVQKL